MCHINVPIHVHKLDKYGSICRGRRPRWETYNIRVINAKAVYQGMNMLNQAYKKDLTSTMDFEIKPTYYYKFWTRKK